MSQVLLHAQTKLHQKPRTGPLRTHHLNTSDPHRPSHWPPLLAHNLLLHQTPFFLWNASLIVIYAISLVQLQGMQGPLSSLNLASRVTYRYTRIRAVAFAMVAAGDAAARAEWRQMLSSELRLFESDYGTQGTVYCTRPRILPVCLKLGRPISVVPVPV